MKITKRKTAIKCPVCKSVIIGFKYPPLLEGFSCNIKHNEVASRMSVRYYVNNILNIQYVCKDCEIKLKQNKYIEGKDLK